MTTLTASDHPLYLDEFVPAHKNPKRRTEVKDGVAVTCRFLKLSAEQQSECIRAAMTCFENGNTVAFAIEYGGRLASRKQRENEAAAQAARHT